MPRTVYIETVGCQMNVLDSELVIAALHKAGYRIADQPADADLVLFNTCSVREHAEDKVYSALGRVAPLKKARPGTVVGVLGCTRDLHGSEGVDHAQLAHVGGVGVELQSQSRLVGLGHHREVVVDLEHQCVARFHVDA